MGMNTAMRFVIFLMFLVLAGCRSIPEMRAQGRTEIYPIPSDQAWNIALAVFRWEGASKVEERRVEGYMVTASARGPDGDRMLMVAWIEQLAETQTKVTVVTERRVGAKLIATVTDEIRFHRRFAETVDAMRAGKTLSSLEFPEAVVTQYEVNYRPLSDEEVQAIHEPSSPSSGYIPVVDPATITDRARFARDLQECGVLAQTYQRQDRVTSGAVGSAIGGAGLGALLSWILGGHPGRGAAMGAVTAGTSGALAGAAATQGDYEIIYANCMRGRGWIVLR
jgi:uncharacterized protein YcfJ